MATLDKNPAPGDWSFTNWSGKGYDRQAEQIKAFDEAGELIRFQRYDGYAMYRVASRQPLVLQHIPYGDAYEVEPALIRGLLLEEVDAMLEQMAGYRRLFAGRR
jgi:hypothetical protein